MTADLYTVSVLVFQRCAAAVVAATFAFRNATHEERLLAYLFNDYEPVARAVMDSNQTVTVTIDFVLLRIHGLVSRITNDDVSARRSMMNFHPSLPFLLQQPSGSAAYNSINRSDSETDSMLRRFTDTSGPEQNASGAGLLA